MADDRMLTFAGGGLDRAAHLRRSPEVLARFRAEGRARVLPVWRGKPLLAVAGDRLAPGLIPTDHPALAGAGAEVFLGLEDGTALFARDLSSWEPEEIPDTLGAFVDPSEQRHPDLPPSHRFAELRARMTALSPLAAELAATAKALTGWHAAHGYCARCGAESLAAMAGWQRDCPACGAHHFPRTDPVVIMLITRGNAVLLGRSHGWPDGMYSLLAGFAEPGETVEAAVAREVREETGLEIGPVRYLASQPWPFPASLMLGCRAEAAEGEIALDPVELDDALWLTRERAVDVFAGSDPSIRAPRMGAIAHHLLRDWLADRLD